jgi:hypothetical protein
MRKPLDHWVKRFDLQTEINRLWHTTMAGRGKSANWHTYRRARAALWRRFGFSWHIVNPPRSRFARRRKGV